MKHVLLIMTILQIKNMWSEFRGIFSTTEQDIKRINKIMDGVAIKDEDVFNLTMVISTLIYTIYLSIYYILLGVYLDGILFVALSCLFLIQSWKTFSKITKWINNKEDKNVFKKTLFSRISNATYLAYIGYFVYILITTW